MLIGLAVESALVGPIADKFSERTVRRRILRAISANSACDLGDISQVLLGSLCAAALNSACEWPHAHVLLYAVVHLPAAAVARALTRTTLSSLYSKAVPVANAGVALSVLDVRHLPN